MSTQAARFPASWLAAARPRPVYTRLAATGLLLLALAPAVMLVSALAAGLDLSEDGAFIAVMIAVPLIAAGLVWRFGTWSKILGILVSLGLGFMMFWAAFGLTYPTSFVDFTAGTAWTLGLLSGLGGGIAAIVAKRRDRVTATLEGNERRLTMAVVGLVVLAAVVSMGLNLALRDPVAAGVAQGVPTATMKDFSFTAETYTVPAGEEASIVVHNSDPFMHDFAVPTLGIEPVSIVPGGERLVTISGAEPGTYTIYCTLHSDTGAPDGGEGGMTATLVVE